MALCTSCGRDCACQPAPLCEVRAKGCREVAEYDAWFGHGHIVRMLCCSTCAKGSRAYETHGEKAFEAKAILKPEEQTA